MSDTNDKKPPITGTIRASQAGDKVTVACKMPQGLVLQLYDIVEVDEQVSGGTRRIKMAVPRLVNGREAKIELNGTAYPQGLAPYAPIVGAREPGRGEGFALTHNVPADFWEEWLAQNQHSPLLASGMLFAHQKMAFVEGDAKERVSLRSGLEPMHRDSAGELDDPRAPALSPRGVGKVSTADRAAD